MSGKKKQRYSFCPLQRSFFDGEVGMRHEEVCDLLNALTEERDDYKNSVRMGLEELEAEQAKTEALTARVEKLETVLRECANDGCGLTVGSGTCLELGFSKDDSCWCCNARRALAQRSEPTTCGPNENEQCDDGAHAFDAMRGHCVWCGYKPAPRDDKEEA